ncbi:uncharacterized protein LOC105775361 [Gossypium raimondii]|uniref:uncharacterized protein LOC105775361 n=1 Tax=Gossypium raimondii TaxID=29730 RepID=UPI00227C7F8D|nr:uncharacterized protein LOC105775361 [Gossypium raimondii]
MHESDRVIQQLGCMQLISPQAPKFNDLYKIDMCGRLDEYWATFHKKYIEFWQYRYDYLPKREPFLMSKLATSLDYMDWFRHQRKPYLLLASERSSGAPPAPCSHLRGPPAPTGFVRFWGWGSEDGFGRGPSARSLHRLSPHPLKSTESQQAICGEEVRGNVTIPSPFGIHSRCYSRSWFRVSCKQTHKGEKPFISINGIDLELLVNCDHKGEVGSSTVNRTGTPFFFSSDYNYFGSVGCGNLATIFSNEADPLGGCIQPICGDGASESGCYNRISGNFTSNVVNMTAMYPTGKDDDKRCASAFIFSRLYFREDYPLPIGIHIETTHVPATLSWNSTYCGDAGCELGPGPINFSSKDSCGNVTFQYPFEIIHQHYPNGWFRVICNKTSNGRKMPFLNINGINLEILHFSFLYGNVVVNHSITYFNCRQNNNDGMSLNLTGTPFYYSDFDNVFWSSGCGNLVTVFDNEKGNLVEE